MDMTPGQSLVNLFWLVLVGSGPALVVAAIGGLLVAILQGVMQINDQTLPQVVKTAASSLVLLFFGAYSFGPLFKFAKLTFESIAAFGR